MKLNIDLSGRGGLATRFFGDMNGTSMPQSVYIAGESQIADGIYNPLRYYGYLSPAVNAFTNITESDGGTDFTSEFSCSVTDLTTGDAFFGEADTGASMWLETSSTDLTLTQGVDLDAIGGEFTDLEIYQINGVKKLFYSYKATAAANADIGIADIPYTSGDIDWLSTLPTGKFDIGNHDIMMEVADNGYMYVGASNALHKIDGTTDGGANGTVTPNAILFPYGWVIRDLCDEGGRLFIAIQSGEVVAGNTDSFESNISGIYMWDRQSTVLRMQNFIKLTGVKDIKKIYVSPSGAVRIHVINSEKLFEIREFTGSTFRIIQQCGFESWGNYRDSLVNLGQLTVWYGRDGILYSHGKISPNDNEALYKMGDTLSLGSNFTTGALSIYDASSSLRQAIRLSLEDSVNGILVKKWYPNGIGGIDSVAQRQNAGNIYTPLKYLPQMSTVNYIDVYCLTGTTSGTATQANIKIYFNGSTTAWATKAVSLDDIKKGYKRIDIDKQYINSMQLEIEYATGTAVANATVFAPSFAAVDYTATNTKG